MNEVNFSIIVPLYNKEEYIADCIISVLEQTFADFELIIVDDGSTDSSKMIVKSFDDDRIRLVDKSNGGVSSARNLGIRCASNNYIALLDADDFWESNFLQEVASAIRYTKGELFAVDYKFYRSEIDSSAIISADKNIYSFSKEINEHTRYFEITEYLDAICLRDYELPVTSSTIVFSRHLINHVGYFREDMNKGEDQQYWLRLSQHSNFIFINSVLAYYRRSTGGLNDTKDAHVLSFILELASDLYDRHPKLISTKVLRHVLPILKYNLMTCSVSTALSNLRMTARYCFRGDKILVVKFVLAGFLIFFVAPICWIFKK